MTFNSKIVSILIGSITVLLLGTAHAKNEPTPSGNTDTAAMSIEQRLRNAEVSLKTQEETLRSVKKEIKELSSKVDKLDDKQLDHLLSLYEQEHSIMTNVDKTQKTIDGLKAQWGSGKETHSLKLEEGRDYKVRDLGMEFVWLEQLKFWFGKYEVTNKEYRKFKSDHISQDYEGHDLNQERQPVVFVNYFDAVAYAEWLTTREQKAGRLDDNYVFRLPTKDEWRAVSKCGENRKYPWGNDWPPKYGNYDTDTVLDEYTTQGYTDEAIVSCEVEKSGRSDWGIYGIGGNALEWTSDKYEGEYIVCGASWYHFNPYTLECNFHSNYHPEITFESLGFRLVLAKK